MRQFQPDSSNSNECFPGDLKFNFGSGDLKFLSARKATREMLVMVSII